MPYSMDERYPEDTLFVFLEADWRMYEKDCFGTLGANWQETGFESMVAMIRQEAAARSVGLTEEAEPQEPVSSGSQGPPAGSERAPGEITPPGLG